MELTERAVRRLAVNAQRLAGPRLPPTAAGLLEVARALRCVQIDAVGVTGATTQQLVFWSRVGPYDRALLDRLQFEDRSLFLWLAHAASLVLTEDLPIHRHRMRAYSSRTDVHGRRIAAWLEENQDLQQQVLGEIEARGPLRSRDFANTARTDWRSSGWTEGRSVNRMLDFLWLEGRLMVAGRAGQERLWDLYPRWLPDHAPAERLTPAEVSDRSVAHALRALGAATPQQVGVHFTRWFYPDLKGSFERLQRSGEVRPVTVPGQRGEWFLHRDSLPLLELPWRPRTTLLSPFDNLVADHARTQRLFGFDFKVELYLPAAKRVRGYYAMPILAGDRLVGAVDSALDRRAGVLRVNRVTLEPGERLTDAARRSVADLARFVGAGEVVYPAG